MSERVIQILKSAGHVVAYYTATLLSGTFFRCFMRVRITGRGHLPSKGPFLVVANHISHFDPPLLASALRRKVAWVVALDMYAHPIGAAYFNAIESIPVDRKQTDMKAPRAILKRFQRGDIVGLFPEGGIRAGASSVLGGAPLDEAVAALARLGKVPVVPCVILGADKLYAWRAWLWRTTIDIRFGRPMTVEGKSSTTAREQATLQIPEAMRKLVGELRSEFSLGEDDLPKTPQERWRA